MIENNMRFMVQRQGFGSKLGVWIGWPTDGGFNEVSSLVIEHREDGMVAQHQPPIVLTQEEAGRLMDELWLAGIRPSSIGTGGELEATKYHLEDMRELVFERPRRNNHE